MSEITIYIVANGDDQYTNNTGIFDNEYTYVGDYSDSYYDYRSIWRFINVAIPQGSTINSAVLYGYRGAVNNTPPETVIYGEASSNAAQVTDKADADGRTKTTASVQFDPATWPTGGWQTFPDISDIIQEIVDNPAWEEGNALQLFWEHDAAAGWNGTQCRIRVSAYNYENPMYIVVNYTEDPIKALVEFEGTDGSTTIEDDHNVWTAAGTAQIDTAQAAVGSGSLLLDGDSDYISTPDRADWRLDDGDSANEWTLEFWVRFNGDPGSDTQIFCSQLENANNQWRFQLRAGGTLNFRVRNSGTNIVGETATWNPDGDTWYHLAVSKDSSGKYRFYVDGNELGSGSDSSGIPDFDGPLYVGYGKVDAGTEVYLDGWIDEFKITKGSAYTHNFTFVDDASHGHTADTPTATTGASTPSATVEDASHGHSTDSVSASFKPVAVVSDAAHGHSADAVNAVYVAQVSPEDASHGHSADAVSAAFIPFCDIEDGSHAHTADTVSAEFKPVAVVEDASHAHAADTVSVAFIPLCGVEDSSHAHAADVVSAEFKPVTVVSDAAHGHSADSVSAVYVAQASPEDASHGHSADSVSAAFVPFADIEDCTHAHHADDVAAGNQVIVEDTVHGHTADSVTVTFIPFCEIEDCSHGHAAESPAATVPGAASVEDSTHAHSADSVDVSFTPFAEVADGSHGHAADGVIVYHSIADATHGHSADDPVAVPEILIESCSHGHTADSPVAGVGEVFGQLEMEVFAYPVLTIEIFPRSVLSVEETAYPLLVCTEED